MEFDNSMVGFYNLVVYNMLDMKFVELEDNLCKLRIFEVSFCIICIGNERHVISFIFQQFS